MSTAAVTSSSIYQELWTFFQSRRSDLQQLGKDLKSGDLTKAQQDYQTLQTLGRSGPFANGDTFAVSRREQDLQNIGTAIQAGDLAGAKKALLQLHQTFDPPPVHAPVSSNSPSPSVDPSTSATPADSSSTSTSATGPEIVLNLGNVPAGEQITIGVSSGSNGTEQVSISAQNPQGQSAGSILLNLAQNSNEQIVLNLFDSAASPSQGSGVNVSA
jgi:hypothetical protein